MSDTVVGICLGVTARGNPTENKNSPCGSNRESSEACEPWRTPSLYQADGDYANNRAFREGGTCDVLTSLIRLSYLPPTADGRHERRYCADPTRAQAAPPSPTDRTNRPTAQRLSTQLALRCDARSTVRRSGIPRCTFIPHDMFIPRDRHGLALTCARASCTSSCLSETG